MSASTAPRPPKGLGATGRRVWRGVFAPHTDGARLELRPVELPLLAEFCRLADDVERLRVELEGAPWTVEGSQGQPVANPLRGELHRCTQRMESLGKTLALLDADGDGSSVGWSRSGSCEVVRVSRLVRPEPP